MANTFTSMIQYVYESLDVVSRELVGFIPAVSKDFDGERASVGQSITFPVVAARTASDVTPASTPPTPADLSAPGTTITISKAKTVPFVLTGEEMKGLGNSSSLQMIMNGAVAQSIRTLVNLIEVDLFTAAKTGASRAYGTAGTTPFATAADMTDLAQLALILDNNGCPQGNRHVVLNNTAIANLRAKQGNLFNSGNSLLLQGSLTQLEGFYVHASGGISQHTKGTGASYVTSGSTAPGVASIALVTGTGTVLAGDVVTFVADSNNKYVVATGVAAPGTIVLGQPGAQVTIATANALTVGNSYTGNFGFDGAAIWLATRPPAAPDQDLAINSEIIVDPVSGLAFELRQYPGYRQMYYEIACAWGYAAVKQNHIATLLG